MPIDPLTGLEVAAQDAPADGDYAGTGKSAAELVALYGTNPDGSPRIEAAPTGPSCPPVSQADGPFDTTTIPSGCSAPLSQECADFYNERYGYSASPPPVETPPPAVQPV